MPWTSSDAKSHTGKADTPQKQKQWAKIANSALTSCMEKGGEDCEASAIKQANGVIAKLSEDSETYHYLYEIEENLANKLEDKTIITIDIFREGKWTHPKYGEIVGDQKLFNDLITNWEKNVVGREIIFDKNHHPEDGGTGIVKNLFVDGDKLKASVELTNFGADLIKNKGFRYFSPEYTSKYVNKETGLEIKNVLLGGALTLRPFLTNLAPIILEERFSDSLYQENIENTELSNDLKEEMWTVFLEYTNNDADKIESITKAVKDYVKEATKEMDKVDNKEIISSIVSTHLDSMMHELMNNMCWAKNYPPIEVKSTH